MLEEININILGVVRMSPRNSIPQLARQAQRHSGQRLLRPGLRSALTLFPVYCATKAFVHSLSLTLRHQLKGKGIKVVELVPPYVSTELGGPSKTVYVPPPGAPQPMPLDAFIVETMRELAGDADEVLIGPAKGMAEGAGLAGAKKIFANMNR